MLTHKDKEERRKWKLDLENRKEDGQKLINRIVITI